MIDITNGESFVPSKLGAFEIKRKLGQGAFGQVFLGIHKKSQEEVAIKIITKSKTDNTLLMRYIENEIKIHKILLHEAIVRHYCAIETELTISMITEYCPKGELFNYILNSSERKLNEKEACRLFQQLISGMIYLHKHSIAHRDIKLENLLLSEQNNLKITDFGLSKEYNEEKLKTRCGSPCYIAPEIVRGEDYSGESIDVWSCGVVLYSMLCGHLPFYDDNQKALFESITQGRYVIPSFLSPMCSDLIKYMLCVDVKKRLTLSQITSHPWFAFVTHNLEHISSPGLFTFKNVIPVDENLVEIIEDKYRYDKFDLIEAIIFNKHNEMTLVYYLELKKTLRGNIESISDISSSSKAFHDYLLKEESKLDYFKFKKSLSLAAHYYRREISKKITQKKNQRRLSESSLLIISSCKKSCSTNKEEKELSEGAMDNFLYKKISFFSFFNFFNYFFPSTTATTTQINNDYFLLAHDKKTTFNNLQNNLKDTPKKVDIQTSDFWLNEIQRKASLIQLKDKETNDKFIEKERSFASTLETQWKHQKIIKPETQLSISTNKVFNPFYLLCQKISKFPNLFKKTA